MTGFNVCSAEKVHIAVASNFIPPMKQIAAQYQQYSDDKLLISYGSSGKLYAQITRGAPFEIFLSADTHKPDTLQKQGLVMQNSRFTYGIGILVLWSADKTLVTETPDLKTLPFNKLAIANPRTAPYGLAAKQTLESLGVYKTIKPKLVQGENIAQTFTFAKTGNAQLGLVALSQCLQLDAEDQGSAWLIPQELHQPIKQDAVLLNGASEAAAQFYQFLQSETVRAIIAESGYRLPNPDNTAGIQAEPDHES